MEIRQVLLERMKMFIRNDNAGVHQDGHRDVYDKIPEIEFVSFVHLVVFESTMK